MMVEDYRVDAQNPKQYLVLADQRGSVLGVVDRDNGQILEKFHYNLTGLCKVTDAAGNEQGNFSNLVPFGYLGMPVDPLTLKNHTHYREYDPITSRWMSEDPAGYQDGLNLYAAYMGINGEDPLGLANWCAGFPNGENAYYTGISTTTSPRMALAEGMLAIKQKERDRFAAAVAEHGHVPWYTLWGTYLESMVQEASIGIAMFPFTTGEEMKDSYVVARENGCNVLVSAASSATQSPINPGRWFYEATSGNSLSVYNFDEKLNGWQRAQQGLALVSMGTGTLYKAGITGPTLKIPSSVQANVLALQLRLAPLKSPKAPILGPVKSGYHSSSLKNIFNTRASFIVDSNGTVFVKPKTSFYVAPDGSTVPATAYRYMASEYASKTIQSMSAPRLSYFGFEKINSASGAGARFQVLRPDWSDTRLRGQFDTLQLFDNGFINARIPYADGGRAIFLEPHANFYPISTHGSGGGHQLIPILDRGVKFNEVMLLRER